MHAPADGERVHHGKAGFALVEAGLAAVGSNQGARVVVEKPFGRDAASSQELDRDLSRALDRVLDREPDRARSEPGPAPSGGPS